MSNDVAARDATREHVLRRNRAELESKSRAYATANGADRAGIWSMIGLADARPDRSRIVNLSRNSN